MTIALRAVEPADLMEFYAQQADPAAAHMAAFAVPHAGDPAAFAARWQRMLDDSTLVMRTIAVDGTVAGNIVAFIMAGRRTVGYWLGREWWGRGIASAALAAFLVEVPARPLYARVAADNFGSRRVLERCGFSVAASERAFAAARGHEIDELIFRLP